MCIMLSLFFQVQAINRREEQNIQQMDRSIREENE